VQVIVARVSVSRAIVARVIASRAIVARVIVSRAIVARVIVSRAIVSRAIVSRVKRNCARSSCVKSTWESQGAEINWKRYIRNPRKRGKKQTTGTQKAPKWTPSPVSKLTP